MSVNGRVAIVTGAGGGLGRTHAFRRGKAPRWWSPISGRRRPTRRGRDRRHGTRPCRRRIGDRRGRGRRDGRADAWALWGRVDILINNAGILRDKSFAKMGLDDFRLVVDVHLMGAVICTKAVWEIMREQQIRPHRDDHLVVRPVRQFRPVQLRRRQDGAGRPDADAGDRGREVRHPGQLPGADRCDADDRGRAVRRPARLDPALVSPGLLALVGEDAPTRSILCAGAGHFARANVTLTEGVYVGAGEDAAER